jgi:hypothetical protein
MSGAMTPNSNSPLIITNSQLRMSGMQPPMMGQSTIQQTNIRPPISQPPTMPVTNQGRGIDPWKNSNPWGNPPATQVNTSNVQAFPMTNSQIMQPLGFQTNQINSNQQMNGLVANLATISIARGSQAQNRSQDQLEISNAIKPPVVQPFQPPVLQPPILQPPVVQPLQPPTVQPIQPPIVQPIQPPIVQPLQPPDTRRQS